MQIDPFSSNDGVAVLGGVLLLLGSGVSVAAPDGTVAQQAAPTRPPFDLDTLSAIQPGLGTVMIEYSHRMAAVWFAGEAGNWGRGPQNICGLCAHVQADSARAGTRTKSRTAPSAAKIAPYRNVAAGPTWTHSWPPTALATRAVRPTVVAYRPMPEARR